MEKTSGVKKSTSFLLRFLRVIVVLAIAIAVAKLLISLRKEPEKKEIVKTPPSVKVMIARPVEKVMAVEAFGTVKPRKLVKISVEVPGRIEYVHPSFIEGGVIPQEELLIRIDQRSYTLNQQTAQVRIRQAKTDIEILKQDIENLKSDIMLSKENLDLSKKELDRVKALSANQFASKNSLDRSEQQYLMAKITLQNISNRLSLTASSMEQRKAALAMAQVDLQKANLSLEKTEIRSDFDGFVLDKFAELGEYVNPGQILGSIYQKDSLDVDVRIPLEKMKWIESFFENGKMPGATITLANDDGMESYAWDAKVARIKAKIDERTRTLPMTLEISNSGKKVKPIFTLKPGAFVKCSIIGETYKDIYVLPRYLLKNDNILFTVSDNHLKMKKVNILRKFEEDMYIDSGLFPGDKIVFSPLPGAIEGMALSIKQNGE